MALNPHGFERVWARFWKKLPSTDELPDSVAASLSLAYPELQWAKKSDAWALKGNISFIASYDAQADELKIYKVSDVTPPDFLRDRYSVELRFNNDFLKSAPVVREIGGRIGQIAAKHRIVDLRGLHVNIGDGNSLCLYARPEEAERYSGQVDLIDFIQRYIIPFLYGLSFFEKNRRWPWGEYGHGDVGIFEFCAERRNAQGVTSAQHCYDALSQGGKELVRGSGNLRRVLCPCGSQILIRKCHTKALEGLRSLRTFFSQT